MAVDGLNTRLISIDADIKAIRSEQGQILAKAQPTPTPINVTDDEAKLVREFLKVSPKVSNAAPKIALWDRLSKGATQPLPEELGAKVTKLKGLRFAIDANNAIALVEPTQFLVVAII
jgi:hypothetical protein